MILKSNKGNTLISVIIALGISGLIISGTMTALTNQLVEQKRISQKYELLELKNTMMRSFTNPAACIAQIPAGNNKVESEGAGFKPITLNTLKLSSSATSPVIAETSKDQSILLPGTSTGLKIKKIEFQILAPTVDGINTEYQGQFVITPDEETTKGYFAPITISQIVKTDGGAPNQIISCNPTTGSITKEDICNTDGGIWHHSVAAGRGGFSAGDEPPANPGDCDVGLGHRRSGTDVLPPAWCGL